jgi:hypothetical protein
MKPRGGILLAAVFSLSLAACSDAAPNSISAAVCDRDCLIELTDSYLAALVAGDTSAVPLATDIAFVENITRLQPGEGLWANAVSGPDNFAIYIPDVVQQQAGFLGVNANNMARLRVPRPGLTSEVPAASRQAYNDLVAIGLSYYDALDDNDGSLMPFADDCQRHGNGMVTADPVTGLALGFSHFRHPFDNLPYDVILTDGTTVERNSGNFSFAPFDMPASHVFKIGADGLVHEIEALGFTAPYNSPTGWQ